MKKARIGTWVVKSKKIFPEKFSVLVDFESGLFIAPDGSVTQSPNKAAEFHGFWWVRNSNAKAFAWNLGYAVV